MDQIGTGLPFYRPLLKIFSATATVNHLIDRSGVAYCMIRPRLVRLNSGLYCVQLAEDNVSVNNADGCKIAAVLVQEKPTGSVNIHEINLLRMGEKTKSLVLLTILFI